MIGDGGPSLDTLGLGEIRISTSLVFLAGIADLKLLRVARVDHFEL